MARILNANHKAVTSEISLKLLNRFATEGNCFLLVILTAISRVYTTHCTPGTKRPSMEWRATGEAAPVKAKTRLSVVEVIMTIFGHAKAVMYVDFLLARSVLRTTLNFWVWLNRSIGPKSARFRSAAS